VKNTDIHKIDLGFSACPNDTFIFHAMLHNKVNTGPYRFIPHIHDVEELNNNAFSGELDITKLSFFAYLRLREEYTLMDTGAAIGFGCGPLLVALSPGIDISGAKIAVPGEQTTAYLFLRLWGDQIGAVEFTRFDKIMPGILSGLFDAGVIIHEGRFVYDQYGLECIVDLGQWWEEETGLPIPLGCIAARKKPEIIAHKEHIEEVMRNSIEFAFNHPDESKEYVRYHAQEMDDNVIDEHIKSYVNEFSLSLGGKGKKAVEQMEEMAGWKGII
jgi:1,4-dihydroxy-6-naphthoate synthase